MTTVHHYCFSAFAGCEEYTHVRRERTLGMAVGQQHNHNVARKTKRLRYTPGFSATFSLFQNNFGNFP